MADDGISQSGTGTRRTKADRLADVHKRAMERFDAIWGTVGKDRERALEDRKFANVRGSQWQGRYAYGDDDSDDPSVGVPRMEVNKIGRSKRRKLSDWRQNRVTVDFRPKGGGDDKTADNLDGLYRADEVDSPGGGQAAYDNAYDEALSGGMGAWRYRPRYEDESDEANEQQRIAIEPIYDADQTVFFDLDAKHQDKSDARFGFLVLSMSREAFEADYPDASPTSFDVPALDSGWEWVTPEVVRLAEYFEVDDHSVLRRTFRNFVTSEERTEDDDTLTEPRDDGSTLEDELFATGWEEIRRRRIKRARVRQYLLSGAETLSDDGYIPGPCIPIVPLYKERFFIDGVEKFESHTGPLIDISRINNTLVSNLTEAAALAPFSQPVFYPEQMDGHQETWARRNIDRLAFLMVNPIRDDNNQIVTQGPVYEVKPPELSPNAAALLQLVREDLAELSGDGEQIDSVPANTSSRAIEIVNDRVDQRDFLELDNMNKAMKRGGEIWLGMARELYVEEKREMIAVDPDGAESRVTLMDPVTTSAGEQMYKNDLSRGSYSVVVDIGPASKTRREATVRNLMSAAQVAGAGGDTETANAALGVALISMDGEGLDDFQAWKRKGLVRGGVVQPTEEEQRQMEEEAQNAQPDPQAQLVQAAAAQAQAEAEYAQSKSIESQAKAEQARANTAKVLSEIDDAQRDRVLKAVELLMQHQQHRDGLDERERDRQMSMETTDA